MDLIIYQPMISVSMSGPGRTTGSCASMVELCKSHDPKKEQLCQWIHGYKVIIVTHTMSPTMLTSGRKIHVSGINAVFLWLPELSLLLLLLAVE